ncbi:MAG: nucleotidyltransferase family protein [Elusimicrobiota bacterium]
MKTLDEIKTVITTHKAELQEKFKVKTIGVFGSYVRGDQRADSDVDILVDFSGSVGLITYGGLERHLSELIGNKVDLVHKSGLKPFIGQQILAEVIYI